MPLPWSVSDKPIATSPVVDPPSGAAIEVLLRTVEQHAEEERDTVEMYLALAERTADGAVRVLLEILVEDERKHHVLFQRIAARIEDDINWATSDEALPVAAVSRPAADPGDVRLLLNAAKDERRGSRELRRLGRERSGLNGGLFRVLLEAMADDSEKHAHILDFAARRLAGRD